MEYTMEHENELHQLIAHVTLAIADWDNEDVSSVDINGHESIFVKFDNGKTLIMKFTEVPEHE